MIQKIKNRLGQVRELLVKYPQYRDNKNAVIAHILYYSPELPQRLKTPEVLEVFKLMAEGKLASIEGIERSWRKALEQDPELRGSNYQGRQELAQEVRQLIIDL